MRRFAIWTAVSTVKQTAGDKTSLKEQEKICRKVGEGKGWTESAGPFVVPGQSRTRWVNLRDAEREIPALHAMLESAKRRQFDILLLYDYNRLRSQLDAIAETLASYGIQIYSVNQPVEPSDDFDIHDADGESMMRGLAGIISRWQIADLRRKFKYGVSARVHRGLHSTKIPWGYAKQHGHEVPVVVPSQAAIIIEIKNMFLAGVPMRKMIAVLNGKYPTPKRTKAGWSRPSIIRILENPYYAGRVFFGLTKTIRDPHQNTTQVVKNPNPIIVDGKHQALYSWEEYLAIQDEFQRRAGHPNNAKYTYSGLLRCSVCGKRLYHWRKDGRWRCEYPREGKGHNHILLRTQEAHTFIPEAIRDAIARAVRKPAPIHAKPPDTRDAVADLERQRARIQEGFEAGLYDLPTAKEKVDEIDRQIRALQDEHLQQERVDARARKYRENLETVYQELDDLPRWIREEDPRKMNDLLLKICEEIVVSPDWKVEIKLRGV